MGTALQGWSLEERFDAFDRIHTAPMRSGNENEQLQEWWACSSLCVDLSFVLLGFLTIN
jgi:hypothetical protein